MARHRKEDDEPPGRAFEGDGRVFPNAARLRRVMTKVASPAKALLGLSLVGTFFWFCLLRTLLPAEEVTLQLVLLTIGAGSVASIAGMIAVFAPAGIGVRDGTQAAFLTLLLPDPVAIAIVLAARLAVVAGDVAYFGLSVLATRRRGRPPAPPPPSRDEERT